MCEQHKHGSVGAGAGNRPGYPTGRVIGSTCSGPSDRVLLGRPGRGRRPGGRSPEGGRRAAGSGLAGAARSAALETVKNILTNWSGSKTRGSAVLAVVVSRLLGAARDGEVSETYERCAQAPFSGPHQ